MSDSTCSWILWETDGHQDGVRSAGDLLQVMPGEDEGVEGVGIGTSERGKGKEGWGRNYSQMQCSSEKTLLARHGSREKKK